MPALEAAEYLEKHGTKLSAPDLRDMTLAATGDKDKAEEAYLARIAAQMKAGLTPEV